MKFKMKKLISLLIVGVIGITAFFAWWQMSITPANSSDTTPKIFAVTAGEGIRDIANRLKSNNLIRNQVAFFIYVKATGLETKIQAGDFRLSPSMTLAQLADALTHGTTDVWITIPEGWRSEEIREFLEKQPMPYGNREITMELQDWQKKEGKFFPDTYLVPKSETIIMFLDLMFENFSKKVTFPVTDKQLIVASLVEREAKTEEDRPLVASVIYNRLEAGMALDIDATVQYALGQQKNGDWWKKDLTQDDLKVKSPYNTYQNVGLPPVPICNPGLSAINAAISPAQTNYLFYLHDSQGNAHFAKTLQEHNANVAKYL